MVWSLAFSASLRLMIPHIVCVCVLGHRETTSGMGKLYAEQVTKILCVALTDMVTLQVGNQKWKPKK